MKERLSSPPMAVDESIGRGKGDCGFAERPAANEPHLEDTPDTSGPLAPTRRLCIHVIDLDGPGRFEFETNYFSGEDILISVPTSSFP